MTTRFDDLDIQLLETLQENNQATAEALGKRISLSASAVHRRIRGYRDDGVIASDVAILSPDAVGARLTVMISLQLDRRSQAADDVRGRILASPHIQVCLDMTGPHDLVCIAVFRDMAQLNKVIEDLFVHEPTVRRYEETFARRRLKFSTALPLVDR